MKTMFHQAKHVSTCICFLTTVLIACSDEGEKVSDLQAVAGPDMNVLINQQVSLNGTLSKDLKGNPFEYKWRFITKPSGSSSLLQDEGTAITKFKPDKAGKYKVELEISNMSTSLDTVLIAAFDVKTILGNYKNITPGPNVGIRDFAVIGDKLYATCEFSKIGGIDANKIACFNGTKWSALGCGLEEGSIYDMIGYKGDVYVTGDFDEIGCITAHNIARWDGTNWNEVAGGLTGGDDPYGFTLSIYNNELFVGGLFQKAGDVNALNIAKWDGTKWSAVGSLDKGSVRELQVYKQKLYAGGYFREANGIKAEFIAAYDGTNWSALGSTNELEFKGTGVVRHMAVYKDLLYISGDFTYGSNDEISELITWDGTSFNDFGRAFSISQNNNIKELAVINETLYIGGSFIAVVGSVANNILQWNGTQWGIMAKGISGTVLSIQEYKGEMWIGGDFKEAGGLSAENMSIWKEE